MIGAAASELDSAAGAAGRRDPELPLGIALIGTALLVPALLGSEYWSYIANLLVLYAAVAVLQNMLLADAGQVSFGQGAVFGVAAYGVGIFTGLHGYSFASAALLAIPLAILVGSLYALPALRVQGYYLGFVTLSAAVVFPEMLVAFNSWTNGINGIRVTVPALNTPLVAGVTPLSIIVFGLGAAALCFHAWLRRQRLGQRMIIAAASPEAALSLGFSPGHVRSVAFVIAATGTAIAGTLYVPLVGFVSPSAFQVELSIFFFFSVIVGGQGRLIGPLVGVAILYLVPNALLVDLVQYRLLGYGAVALAIMLAFPDGIVGTLAKRLARRSGEAAQLSLDLALAFPAAKPKTKDKASAVEVMAARKRYGELAALDDVCLVVEQGSIHGLVGPNGSGKTTLLNAISGFVRLDGGSLRIFGEDGRRAAWRIARAGVGRTFQTPRVFDALSIRENIDVGAPRSMKDVPPLWDRLRPDLLPHAQRRLLEVLRVVASDADLLLLDEPAAGLSPEERTQFAQLLRVLRDRLGKTILFVEHDLALVWRVADRITVLDAGKVIADGPPAAIIADPRVRALFTGAADA